VLLPASASSQNITTDGRLSPAQTLVGPSYAIGAVVKQTDEINGAEWIEGDLFGDGIVAGRGWYRHCRGNATSN